ncbi:hypothetical protein EGR_02187 [Echinococcus granulosus]|uniref:Uncharacterized protein n=1 Tax=Echinococcus granulosus TaxID=6210 RepID=W6UPC9_ECHGR|nr:hypothetical protein EGR_02187 [Echinococcus granulosus]EUB63093.1 hypothetical protein EGR_02187 [Echinococcus granulosus]
MAILKQHVIIMSGSPVQICMKRSKLVKTYQFTLERIHQAHIKCLNYNTSHVLLVISYIYLNLTALSVYLFGEGGFCNYTSKVALWRRDLYLFGNTRPLYVQMIWSGRDETNIEQLVIVIEGCITYHEEPKNHFNLRFAMQKCCEFQKTRNACPPHYIAEFGILSLFYPVCSQKGSHSFLQAPGKPEGRQCKILLDSGAVKSLMSFQAFPALCHTIRTPSLFTRLRLALGKETENIFIQNIENEEINACDSRRDATFLFLFFPKVYHSSKRIKDKTEGNATDFLAFTVKCPKALIGLSFMFD